MTCACCLTCSLYIVMYAMGGRRTTQVTGAAPIATRRTHLQRKKAVSAQASTENGKFAAGNWRG